MAELPRTGEEHPIGRAGFDPDFVYRYGQTPDLTVAQLEAATVAVARRMRVE
jgi:hypothetical protein